jgi:hypothetical protein
MWPHARGWADRPPRVRSPVWRAARSSSWSSPSPTSFAIDRWVRPVTPRRVQRSLARRWPPQCQPPLSIPKTPSASLSRSSLASRWRGVPTLLGELAGLMTVNGLRRRSEARPPTTTLRLLTGIRPVAPASGRAVRRATRPQLARPAPTRIPATACYGFANFNPYDERSRTLGAPAFALQLPVRAFKSEVIS